MEESLRGGRGRHSNRAFAISDVEALAAPA
jgi:hypothetical protein